MSNCSSRRQKSSGSAVDQIHEQMESNPHFPFNIQSGWLPAPHSIATRSFLEKVLTDEPEQLAPSVQAMAELLSGSEVLTFLMKDACEENGTILAADLPDANAVHVPRIQSQEQLLNAFNSLLTEVPRFIDDELVGLPFSALVVGIDPTMSGRTLFRLPMFNEKMGAILNEWNSYLASEQSNWVFAKEGEEWLSPKAKAQYQFEVWAKDSETLPYWNSWNSFFTRQFKDRNASRPIAAPESNQVVVSANDGSLFRWEENVPSSDVFWFKDMAYSIADILSSDVPEQQKVIDDHDLVDLFTEGSIFQTYLNPYNFHRWWCPVNAEVVFDPIAVPGCYFNKLVIPDFAGATTASLPYLAQVNARGLIVFKTEDYGYVCAIPLGMSEVSSVAFDPAMKAGAKVTKGQEMGKFMYGGSSFALLYQQLPGKRLVFQNGAGDVFAKRPTLPKGSASTGGNVTLIGAQIGKWEEVDSNIDSQSGWQNCGYVNAGKSYTITYVGGLWTANPEINDGNLYGPNGSSVVAEQPGYPLVGANEGALIARVGNHEPFVVGDKVTLPAGQTGHLQLCINDDLEGRYGAGLTDNTGQLIVQIRESM